MPTTSKSEHHYGLLIAGGAGTRLWPLSRKDRPKQFQKFVKEETLLQHMTEMVRQVLPLERIFIMATPEFAEIIFQQIPTFPKNNLLFEPSRKDTGPAIILAMMQIAERDPEAIVAALWADHNIEDSKTFAGLLTTAFYAAEEHPDAMVTMGAKPLSPDTGLGYIQMGDEIDSHNGNPIFAVKRFVEKPDLATATEFVNSREYLWNMGYNFMHAKYMIEISRKLNPELAEVFDILQKACASGEHSEITSAYEKMPKISIDYLVVEHLTNLLVVPADVGWSDIGNWKSLQEILRDRYPDAMVTKGSVINLESENCLVFSKDRVITTVGLKDLIIVDDGDALLVMHKDSAQAIKLLTQKLESTNPELL